MLGLFKIVLETVRYTVHYQTASTYRLRSLPEITASHHQTKFLMREGVTLSQEKHMLAFRSLRMIILVATHVMTLDHMLIPKSSISSMIIASYKFLDAGIMRFVSCGLKLKVNRIGGKFICRNTSYNNKFFAHYLNDSRCSTRWLSLFILVS